MGTFVFIKAKVGEFIGDINKLGVYMQVNKVQSLNELMTSDSCVLKRNREDEDSDINRVSGVRLRFKPIHALSLLLVLVAALCASLTLLITQSVNYSRAETYRINSLKSPSHDDSSYLHYDEHESASESNKEAEDDDAKSVGVDRVGVERVNGKRVDSKKSNVSENVSENASVEKSENKSASKSENRSEGKSKSKSESKSKNKVNSESSAEKSSCINLNTASVEKLQQLRGVGPKMAERIIAHRKRFGSFKRINDLMNVKGIGAKTLAKFREKVCFK
ncbi:competence protein ComEA [Gardnerella vaginalis]|uniref:Competence protein ComEA n=2 Tax=Bifidobacteriaceae TaxID=31953 RepID=A0A2K1STQ9_GARVA|nr:competence protein ComEA [Gardnerella vaginalis]